MVAKGISNNERVIFVGKTGTGKTFLAKQLLKNTKRLVVLDTKSTLTDWNLDDWESGREVRNRLLEGKPVRARIRVDPLTTFEETFVSILIDVYNARNCILYIDEMYGVVPNAQTAPPILVALYTRGRELGIGVFSSTQRPTGIPLVALSEAEHFFMFKLTLKRDLERMAEFMSESVFTPIRDPHGFYYYNSGDEQPTYISKYNKENKNVNK